jgi:4-alpha-glucanotransferase
MATDLGTSTSRASGILLHVTSLPGSHGVGDLGPAAYRFVDQLAAARQSWWQILPLGPTGYADSPYQCFSAFAGNPRLVSLEVLAQEGLLDSAELPPPVPAIATADYDTAAELKATATARAYRRFARTGGGPLAARFDAFCRAQAHWLDAFALFMALKEQHGGASWLQWPAQYREYDAASIALAARELAPQIELHKFRQFLFFDQWRRLREYAHARGVRFIGDMPIFVSADSADVWSRPELFQLDDQRRPAAVAGVPPDYFSETGQLWGNPLYDWPRHEQTGFRWWIDRLRTTLELVDLVRLDHFRGFEAYWRVPAGSATAEPGAWVPGPGGALFFALQQALGSLPLIAEDLGVITPPVDALRRAFGLPGMRVLQFAFGGAQEDRFLPHHFVRHTVVYTGTHDNETAAGWYENLTAAEQQGLERYAPGAARDPAWTLIRLAWASVANWAIAPLQDVLQLGNEARMNLPGRTEGNWKWRLLPGQLSDEVLKRLAQLTETYQRVPTSESSVEPPT